MITFIIGDVGTHMISDDLYIACETPSLQNCNHMIDCSVQCAVGARNCETTVLSAGVFMAFLHAICMVCICVARGIKCMYMVCVVH